MLPALRLALGIALFHSLSIGALIACADAAEPLPTRPVLTLAAARRVAAAALRGGVPLIYQGRVVGAIGVSGDSPQIDEDIANAGAAALPAD